MGQKESVKEYKFQIDIKNYKFIRKMDTLYLG
jgi:hypothetical protein